MTTDKGPLEGDIQKTICQYLSLLMAQGKLFFWRQNTSAIFDHKSKSFRAMPKFALKGVPDIIIVKGPFVIFLEVKRKGTKQSPDQVQFEKYCKAQGCEYYVVRSLDDVLPLGLESDR